ncbi:MAG: hypothetical protein A2033_19545 [Bacteroidetes bacterium GWA2_31_9]|nr:MAG: hypothetical protein A2033_19545 [Bacteroidetes bacterium GWA2_31_9]
MRTVILNIKNNGDYPLLLQFVKQMGIDITIVPEEDDKTEKKKTMATLYKLLDSVKKNELFAEIKNPVQWQKKLRNEWK